MIVQQEKIMNSLKGKNYLLLQELEISAVHFNSLLRELETPSGFLLLP